MASIACGALPLAHSLCAIAEGEGNGPESRLFLLRNEGGAFSSSVVQRGVPARELYRFNDEIALIGERSIRVMQMTWIGN